MPLEALTPAHRIFTVHLLDQVKNLFLQIFAEEHKTLLNICSISASIFAVIKVQKHTELTLARSETRILWS